MVLDSEWEEDITTNSGTSRFKYRFFRDNVSSSHNECSSIMESHICKDDPIVISTENGHYALAIGFVVDLQPNAIWVSVDRNIRGSPVRTENFDEHTNQEYGG